MNELERIKQLAGLNKESSMGENLSYIGTKKAQYQPSSSLCDKHPHR